MSEGKFTFFHGSRIYVSDGITANIIADNVEVQFPGETQGTALQSQVLRAGRRVYFKGDNINDRNGYELWVTDGTAEGTKQIKNINTEASNADNSNVANAAITFIGNMFNEKVLFKAWSPSGSNELWAYDIQKDTTYQIDSNNHWDNPNTAGNAFVINEVAYIACRCGDELGVTNGESGNKTVYDINASGVSHPDGGVGFDNRYMFCAADWGGGINGELFMFDGDKVQVQYDLAGDCDWVKELTVCGGSLYWRNEGSFVSKVDGTTVRSCIIRLDAYDATPQVVAIHNATTDNKVYCLRNLDGSLLYYCEDDNQIYTYYYRQANYDETKNPVAMNVEFNTRAGLDPNTGKPTAVETIAAGKAEVVAYPSPATEVFYIKGVNETCNVKVYDIAGRLHIALNNVAAGQAIDASHLASGYYKVVVSTADATETTSLIVK